MSYFAAEYQIYVRLVNISHGPDWIRIPNKFRVTPLAKPSKIPARHSKVLHGPGQEEEDCAVKYHYCTILGLTHNWHTGALWRMKIERSLCAVISYRDTGTRGGSGGALSTRARGLQLDGGGDHDDHEEAGEDPGGLVTMSPALTHWLSEGGSLLCHHWDSSGDHLRPGGARPVSLGHWHHGQY